MFEAIWKKACNVIGLQRATRSKRRVHLRVEELEPRVNPNTVWRVTTVADAGVGSLRATMTDNALADGDEIRLEVPLPPSLGNNADASRYQETISLLSPIVCTKNVSIVGQPIFIPTDGSRATRIPTGYHPMFYSITIDGSQGPNGAHRAFFLQNPNLWVSVAISQLGFTGCVGPQNGAGGAIFARGSLSLTNCQFDRNRIVGGSGGAVDIKPWDVAVNTSVIVTGCVFTRNSAGNGGAINVEALDIASQQAEVLVSINASTFDGNRASVNGGAIQVAGLLQTLAVNSSAFDDNTADEDGGAINATCKTLTIVGGRNYSSLAPGIEFLANQAGTSGGAVNWEPGNIADAARNTSLTLQNLDFSDNQAGVGGGVAVFTSSGGDTTTETITGCLFNHNQAN